MREKHRASFRRNPFLCQFQVREKTREKVHEKRVRNRAVPEKRVKRRAPDEQMQSPETQEKQRLKVHALFTRTRGVGLEGVL